MQGKLGNRTMQEQPSDAQSVSTFPLSLEDQTGPDDVLSKLTVVIPAYNEAERIGDTLESYLEHFPVRTKFLVEMDGCSDGTGHIVSRFSQIHQNLSHIRYTARLGKGGGLKAALQEVDTEYIAFADADCSIAPEEFEKVVRRLIDCDCAIGSRYVEGARIEGELPLRRVIASRAFNLFVRLILNLKIRDTQCGAKAFKTDVLKTSLDRVSDDGFGFDAELLYRVRRKGHDIEEVPLEWRHMQGSKVDILSTAPKMLFSILRTRLRP